MQGLNFFTYAGVSSQAHHLFITGSHIHSGPERDIEYIAVPGRSGDLILDNGRWKNQELVFECFYRAPDGDTGLRARKIKGWLMSHPGEYLPLETSYQPDYFFLAAFSGPLEIDTLIRRFGTTQIVFNCKPYQYSKAGQKMQDITTVKKLINPEAFESRPYIKITGTGNIRFTVGGDSWDFQNVDGFIEIDSGIMNVFRATQAQNNKKIGDGYPVLNPGLNNFAWTGNVSKVEIIPRWRAL